MNIQKYKRGQIWWMRDNSPEQKEHLQSGTRPIIIVSNDAANKFSNNITVVPCTTAEKKELPTHVKFEINESSTALCEMITTISNSNIMSYIGTCDEELMNKINHALEIALGLKQVIEENSKLNENSIKELLEEKVVIEPITKKLGRKKINNRR